jgi:hypothetical protein
MPYGAILAAELSRSVGAANDDQAAETGFRGRLLGDSRPAAAPKPSTTQALSVERVVACSIEAWPACHKSAATARV